MPRSNSSRSSDTDGATRLEFYCRLIANAVWKKVNILIGERDQIRQIPARDRSWARVGAAFACSRLGRQPTSEDPWLTD
jgi:hypothetical protein